MAIRQVCPTLSGYFKRGLFPAGVAMGGTINRAELDLVCGAAVADTCRKRHLEQRLAFVPVHIGDEVDTWRTRVHTHPLDDARAFTNPPRELQHRSFWT